MQLLHRGHFFAKKPPDSTTLFEGKKNGGLEVSFKTADGGANLKQAPETICPGPAAFSFPGRGRSLVIQ